jgi:hypothetical protein
MGPAPCKHGSGCPRRCDYDRTIVPLAAHTLPRIPASGPLHLEVSRMPRSPGPLALLPFIVLMPTLAACPADTEDPAADPPPPVPTVSDDPWIVNEPDTPLIADTVAGGGTGHD